MTKKREYPMLALEKNKILKVVESISRFGGSATRQQIVEDTGIKVGIGTIIASAKQYGLIKRQEGSANLSLTDLGKTYCLAIDDEGRKAAIVRTILNVPHYKKLVHEKDFYKEPSLSVLKQIMVKYGIPEKDAGAVAGVFRRNLSDWGLTFNQLKTSEGLVETLQAVETKPSIVSDKLVSGIKLAWTISYIKYSHKELDKQALLNILDDMEKQSISFKELLKEIEATKKFSRYSDEKGIVSYINDHFENALAKDLGIEKISDLIESKPKKTKERKEVEKSAKGESAEDETGESRAVG